MRQVPRVWDIAGRIPGKPVGLVIGTSAPTGPGWEASAEEMDCSEGKTTGTAYPSNYAGSRMVPRLSFTWCNYIH